MAAALMADRAPALLALELSLLLEALYQRHGVDLRDCHAAHLMPVLDGLMHCRGIGTISALQERVLHDQASHATCWPHWGC